MPTEQENYFRMCLLLLEVVTPLLQKFLDNCLLNRNQNLKVFIQNHQHKLYHSCFLKECCKCVTQSNTVQDRPLSTKQFELLFDCSNPKGANHNDYCCATVKPNISTEDLDISLMNVLLLNFFSDAFWDFLDNQDFESFLNSNKHAIFHMYIKTNCCICENGYAFSTTPKKPKRHIINKLYRTNEPRCKDCSKLTNGNSITPCSMVAKKKISKASLNEYETGILQQYFSSTRSKLDEIVDLRNTVFAHATKAYIPDAEFTSLKKQFVNASLWLSDRCGIRQFAESLIQQKIDQPFDMSTQKVETMIREHRDEAAELKKVILEFNKSWDKQQEDRHNTLMNIEETVLRAERTLNFYNLYTSAPSLFIEMQILTLSTADTNHLCDDGLTFKIKPASYPASKVFMSILREGWIRFSDTEQKYIEFLFQRAKNSNGGKQYYHIKPVAHPNHYITMGFWGWWVRAKFYDDQPTDDAATWDIRCLKTDELSLYILVPKNSEDFVCVDFTRRLKGSCGGLDYSNMFLFERVQ